MSKDKDNTHKVNLSGEKRPYLKTAETSVIYFYLNYKTKREVDCIEGGIWNVIVLIPDRCLFYLLSNSYSGYDITRNRINTDILPCNIEEPY